MGTYLLDRGEDASGPYFSYYDRWDLDRSPEGREGWFGKPFELYDRLYFNPETKQIYWEGPPKHNARPN